MRKYSTSLIRQWRQKLITKLNQLMPKAARVVVVGFPNVESSAIATANYIATHYTIPVTYVVSSKLKDDPTLLLKPGIKILNRSGSITNQLLYLMEIFRSKYLFLTHGLFLTELSKTQVVTNIWHGVLYKKIGLLIGGRSIPADVTVGTSLLTVKMFAAAFGVAEGSIFISGYPRNDLMLDAKANKEKMKALLGAKVNTYKKVLIWLPTFRKNTNKKDWQDGIEAGNPFYIPDFDVEQFNHILKEHHAICYVKPHPMAVKYPQNVALSHVQFIDEQWISARGLTLYHLLGCTDLLISDVSSVVIDYLLMEQPILCVSTDFEAYQQSRGFYFEAIEQWLPSTVIRSEDEFFETLRMRLKTGEDPFEKHRQALKHTFFQYTDANSTARLVQHIFKLSKLIN